jgi:hypothetical protein
LNLSSGGNGCGGDISATTAALFDTFVLHLREYQAANGDALVPQE